MRTAIVILLCSLVMPNVGTAGIFLNSGAETGDTSGWTTTSTGVIAVSSANAGTLGLPVGVSIGNFSFTGGLGGGDGAFSESISQAVDVSALSLLIDAGQVKSDFSVWLQSRVVPDASDTVSGVLQFRNGAASVLSTVSFADPVINNNVFDWNQFTDLRTVPVSTRSIFVRFDLNRNVGVSTDPFFDNVELNLRTNATVPEPASLTLWGLGALGLCVASRRRKQAA